jgi:hypothetical protein
MYIARKTHHQGGKGFILVVQNSDIQFALDQGMQYFQVLSPKALEYRVHVMNGEALFTVKKVLQENPYDNWKAERRELIEKKAEQGRITLNEETLDLALEVCGKSLRLPNNIIRGLKEGWKFTSLNNPAAALRNIAINAVAAVELDFGAVDVMKLDDGTFQVLEVNSGPGLKGDNIGKYATAIANHYRALTRVEPETPARRTRTTTGRAGQAATVEGGGSGNLAGQLERAFENVEDIPREERDQLYDAILRIARRL